MKTILNTYPLGRISAVAFCFTEKNRNVFVSVNQFCRSIDEQVSNLLKITEPDIIVECKEITDRLFCGDQKKEKLFVPIDYLLTLDGISQWVRDDLLWIKMDMLKDYRPFMENLFIEFRQSS